MADLGADEVFELKLLFLQELAQGHAAAREVHEKLRKSPGDLQLVKELRNFFHRISGTALSVDLPLLGHLAAACEGTCDLLLEGSLQPSRRTAQMLGEGLAGVHALLESAGDSSALRPPRPAPLAQQMGLEGVPSRILVIDDDPFSARLIDSVLRAAGFISSFCCQPEKAFEVIQQESPDLIILDVVMPNMDGFALCARVRADATLQLTPIIFVTRKGDVEQRVRGLQVGGNDYVSKPFEPQELVARVRSHLQRLAELREMAIRDGLTRCYNNKYFKMRLEQEIVRARRYGAELTLGMLDIDHFKKVNDTYGHPAGDVVLAHLASLLVASVRSTDVVARYGGEEFGFLLVEAALPEAEIISNRLRERIARHQFVIPHAPGKEGGTVSATVSIGIAPFLPDDSVQTFIQRADGALYQAKSGGRNKVGVASIPRTMGEHARIERGALRAKSKVESRKSKVED